jgi:hypothetical protein
VASDGTSISKLKADAAAARKAADAAIDREPKDKQRELAVKAVALENQLAFAEWRKLWEDEGYTVEGDSFATASVTELAEGPTYDETPGT